MNGEASTTITKLNNHNRRGSSLNRFLWRVRSPGCHQVVWECAASGSAFSGYEDKLMTGLLSLAWGLAFSFTLLGNCIGCFSILLFCPLVGSAPVVGSVHWTAEEILQLRQILFGWKQIFEEKKSKAFYVYIWKMFSILAVQIGASALYLPKIKVMKIKYCWVLFEISP